MSPAPNIRRSTVRKPQANLNGSKQNHPRRIDVAGVRREQIIEAAAHIIAGQGIQHLSLSAIEGVTGMSRGQLTYYFKAKEDILLAVFDRTVGRMRDRVRGGDVLCAKSGTADVWPLIQQLLNLILQQPIDADFARLQYTFLAQPGPRDDFRKRLAALYEEWRSSMAEGIARLSSRPMAEPRLLASLVQATIHGLVMQLQADPAAFERTGMLDLCLDVLGSALKCNSAAPQTNPSGEGR